MKCEIKQEKYFKYKNKNIRSEFPSAKFPLIVFELSGIFISIMIRSENIYF